MVESGSRFTKVPPHLEEEEDRISTMPDHILVLILNLMTTEEGRKGEIEQVVRTSILSRRWRSLWKYSLKSLAFTISFGDALYYLEHDSVCEAAHRGFVDRVNVILALPVVGNTVEDFNLDFWMTEGQTYWSDHLPGWIGFALQKRVKRLSIKLRGSSLGCFALDEKIIRNHNMDSLVSLLLYSVDVAGEFLEHLLTICGSLEHMSITESGALVDFTVSGPCLKLKYLEIRDCENLRRLHIHSVNLVSFDYGNSAYENEAAVVIEDAPHLVNAGLNCLEETANVLSYLPQLRTLLLAFDDYWFLQSPLVFPKLINLVKVKLELCGKVSVSIICASLLASCPSMSELVLEFISLKHFFEDNNKVERLKHPHECLKMVELVGFIGCKLDTGVALYLIENTLSLDKIVVDTSHPYGFMETRSIDEEVEDLVSRMETKLSESEMRELADSVSRARADRYESDMRERARARAHAREHLATRLSHTMTQIVLK